MVLMVLSHTQLIVRYLPTYVYLPTSILLKRRPFYCAIVSEAATSW